MTQAGPTRVVLFDLGGVLVELGGVEMFGGWIGESDEAEVWRRWLGCPWVRRYERGECSTDEFARGMVESWALPIGPDEFLVRFRDWVKGLNEGAAELVGALAPGLVRACFSNTNACHWDHVFHAFGLDEMFERSFLSYRMGLVKPDFAAFAHVVRELDVDPAAVLFLDDNLINVEGARAAGIDAHRAVGVGGARRVLADRGLLA
ncbi:MAG: HAD-IA family hydrolase [Myxococcota bacterium]